MRFQSPWRKREREPSAIERWFAECKEMRVKRFAANEQAARGAGIADDLIEYVARVLITEHSMGKLDSWESQPECGREAALNHARAVLVALKRAKLEP